jgi:hypothetical protein
VALLDWYFERSEKSNPSFKKWPVIPSGRDQSLKKSMSFIGVHKQAYRLTFQVEGLFSTHF